MSRAAAGVVRLARAWRALPREHRLAAAAAGGLFLTLFLPWYQETVVTGRHAASASLTGWGAFSLIEALLLAVAAGVLVLLFRRAEGRGLRSPRAEGVLILAAGGLAFVLVMWRIFDKQTVQVQGPGTAISGLEWGIFIALGAAAWLAYTGRQVRSAAGAAQAGDDQPTGSFEPISLARSRAAAPRRRRRRPADAEQLTIPLEEREGD